MINKIGIKLLYTCITLIILFFTSANCSLASDYQYKILDPKYNPEAQKIVDGKIPPMEETEPYETHKGFDFGTFFAIFGMIVFPILIISLAVKTFREFNDAVPGRDEQRIGNIKIEPKEPVKVPTKEVKTAKAPVINKTVSTPIAAKPQIRSAQRKVSPSKKLTKEANTSINKYFTSPVKKTQNPMLLYASALANNKGLCLVEYNKKYSLIGYINDEIFMLNQFESVSSSEIRLRLSDSTQSGDRYIVRLGDYKALIEVSESDMNLLLEL